MIPVQPKTTGRLALIVFGVVLVIQAAAYTRATLDDAYIFYKYAENIATGQGYVYNPGETVLGTTSPLYTLVLAAGRFLFGWLPFFSLPLLGQSISALSVAFISIRVAGFFRRAGLEYGAMILPPAFLAMALLWDAVGMDVLPAVALGVAALGHYSDGRYRSAALLAALTVLTRPDAALVPAIMFTDCLVVRRRWPGWAAVGIFVGTFLPWLVFSWIYFGTIVPSSIAAKAIQAQTGLWGDSHYFLIRAVKSWPFHVSIKDATLTAVGVSLAVALIGFRRFRQFREGYLVLVWAFLHMAVYGLVLRPAAYRWYYVPFALALAMVLAMGAEVALERLKRRSVRWSNVALVVLLLWAGITGVRFAVEKFRDPYNYKYRFYTTAAEWLNEHAPSGATVGCHEIGALGYYYRKGPTLDLLGLVSPEVSALLKDGDFARPIAFFRPDYLLLKEPALGRLNTAVEQPWFEDWYRREVILGEDKIKIGVYRFVGPAR